MVQAEEENLSWKLECLHTCSFFNLSLKNYFQKTNQFIIGKIWPLNCWYRGWIRNPMTSDILWHGWYVYLISYDMDCMYIWYPKTLTCLLSFGCCRTSNTSFVPSSWFLRPTTETKAPVTQFYHNYMAHNTIREFSFYYIFMLRGDTTDKARYC